MKRDPRFRLACCRAIVTAAAGLSAASAGAYPASFTLRHNTGGTALRGDNFGSHNQNIAWTENGLFRSGDFQSWPNGSDNVVVQRSTDDGRNWSLLHDTGAHRNDLKPANIEAGPAGNVYILYPSGSGSTRFVKFSPSNNYGSPVVNKNTSAAGSASKFASCYDPARNLIHHATQWGRLLTFDVSGNVVRNQHLITDGGDSRPSYPHLFVDEFGVIHYAMTVADGGDDVPYTGIRYLKSLDGGQSWKSVGGSSVSVPTGASGGSSGATLINRPDEHNYKTWLANMHAKDGKVHFTYQTGNPWDPAGAGNPPTITPYMNYIRYDEATGSREIDRTSLSGGGLSIRSEAASFASDTSNSTGALYVVGERSDGKRLHAMVSYDNGRNWQDYAQSNWYGTIAHPSLARSVTPDGKVVGGVALDTPYWAWVHYLELPAVQDTTTIAHWDGNNNGDWSNAGNYTGNVAPAFDSSLALAIGAGNSLANADPMAIADDRTVRALVFGVAADSAVNIRLKNNTTNTGKTLAFDSAVPGGAAGINVHHNATGNIDIGGGSGLGNVVLNDPLRVNHHGSGFLTISRPVSGSNTITKSGDGEFQLTGNNSGFSGALAVEEGKLALSSAGSENGEPDVHVSSAGTLSIGDAFVGGTATIGNLTGDGRVDPQFGSSTGTRTLRVNQTADGTFSGLLTDATSGADRDLGLNKTGAATLTLTGGATFTGPTTVSAGKLKFSDNGSVCSSIANHATVEIAVSSGDTWILQNDKTLSGSGVWIKTGPGRASLEDTTVTTTGQFQIREGTLRNNYNHSDWSGSAAGMDITAGAILDLYADPVQVDELTGGGIVQNGYGNSSGYSGSAPCYEEFVVGANGGSSTFSGVIRDNPNGTTPAQGTAGGGVQLRKTGAGTQTLTGVNTYTGPTAVDAGTLMVNAPGSLAAAGNVTVAAGATLGGSGTVGGSVAVSGTLAPGASTGTLTAGDVTFEPGSTFEWELADWTGDTPGTHWDLLDAASLTFHNTPSGKLTIRIDGPAANFSESRQTFPIATVSGGITGFDPAAIVIEAPGFPGAGTWSVRRNGNTIELQYPAPFADWIAGFEVGARTGFADDFDCDGLGNGLENLLGTHPAVPNTGLTAVANNGAALTFRHPHNAAPARDIGANYQWSTDLVVWRPSGARANGATVTITPAPGTPAPGATTVTATATGGPLPRLFVRLMAIRSN